MNSKKKSTSKRSAPKPSAAESKPATKKAASRKSTPRSGADPAQARPLAETAPTETLVPSLAPLTRPAPPSPAAPSVVSAPAAPPRKLPAHLTVPPILLEDDSLPSRLAARFAPVPAPAPVALVQPSPEKTEASVPAAEVPAPRLPEPPPAPTLPPHYGTRRLSLLARDPFTLFADWDFSAAEIVEAQRAAARGQVVLRIFRGAAAGPLVLELPVEADRRQEFIPAPVSGQPYHAALGFVGRDDVWHELARSGVAEVPPEVPPPSTSFAEAHSAPTARIEIEAPVARTRGEDVMAPAWVRAALWAEPMVRWETPPATTAWAAPVVAAVWTPALAGASEQLAGPGGPGPQGAASPAGRPTNPSSLEVGLSSEAAVPSAPEAGRGFWFKVNAEVVIYGSTERDAKVTIDGRPVQLRPDGSFSFRFSLPDGAFNLPIRAVAADGLDGREAVFHLTKATVREGEVGDHPQNPALRPPLADHAVSQ